MKRLIYSFLSALFIFSFVSNFTFNHTVSAAQNKNITSIASTGSYFAVAGNEGECDANGNPLSWVVCPIMDLASNILGGLYKDFIIPLLKTQPIPLPGQVDPGNNLEIYSIWSNFRIIGNVVLVIVLLIIVFGESIGGGLIDAYNVRKILPRLLIGAILINLSIYIVAFGLDVTNIVGGGVKDIIEAPFPKEAKVLSFNDSAGGIATGLGTVITAGVAASIALAVWGPMLIMMVLVPTVLVFVITVGLLMLRQGLIMLLVFVAPVAFALWCLPNTEQYFNKWWKTLFTTLLIFPIISVLFALGNVVSFTVGSVMGDNIRPIVQTIGYIAPFYLMPFSFQFAGGMLAAAAGIAASRASKPAMGRLGQARQNAAKQRIPQSKLLNGNLQRGGIVGRGINKAVTTGRAAAAGTGFRGRMGSGKEALRMQQAAQAEEFAKSNPAFAQAMNNEKAQAILALSGGSRAGAQRVMQQVEASGMSDSNKEAWRAAFKTADGVGFNPLSAEAAISQSAKSGSKGMLTSEANGGLGLSPEDTVDRIEQSAQQARGSDASGAIMGGYKFHSKNNGRPDVGNVTTDPATGRRTVDYSGAYKELGAETILMAHPDSAAGFINHFGSGSTEVQAMKRAAVRLPNMPGATRSLLDSM